jgi:hypothetical protein
LTTAKKNSAIDASATPSGMKKTNVLLFIYITVTFCTT